MHLTLRKIEIQTLEFIIECVSNKNYPPTVREICKAINIKSPSSVHTYLSKLERLGYIKRSSDTPRGIEILGEANKIIGKDEKTIYLPLVGNTCAGSGILSEENIEEYIPFSNSLIKNNNSFILRVHGDSMIDAGIFNKDFIIVKKTNSASNNQIVVALINDSETTVKRLFISDDTITLKPANDLYDPIVLNKDSVQIVGVVTGVFREIN